MMGGDLGNQHVPESGGMGVFAFEWKDVEIKPGFSKTFAIVFGLGRTREQAQSYGEALKTEWRVDFYRRKNYLLSLARNLRVDSGFWDVDRTVEFAAAYIASLMKDSPEIAEDYQPCLLNVQTYESHGARYIHDQALVTFALNHIDPTLARNSLLWLDNMIRPMSDPSSGGYCTNNLYFIRAAYEYYKLTGDSETLNYIYPTLKKVLDAFISRPTSFGGYTLYRTSANNWYDYGSYWGVHIYHNVLIYRCLLDFAELSRSLGHADTAEYYEEKAEPLKNAINNVLWRGDYYVEGIADDGTIHDKVVDSALFAIIYGVAEGERAEKILDTARRKLLNPKVMGISSEEIPPGTGYYGNGGIWWNSTEWYLRALAKLKKWGEAFKIILKMGNLTWYNTYWINLETSPEWFRMNLPEHICQPPACDTEQPAGYCGGVSYFPWSYSSIVLYWFNCLRKFPAPHRRRFEKALDRMGVQVEVQEKIEYGEDEFGNPLIAYLKISDEKAIIRKAEADESLVQAGLISAGDAVGLFKAGSAVKRNFRVKFSNVIYEVVSVIPQYAGEEIVYLKCAWKRDD